MFFFLFFTFFEFFKTFVGRFLIGEHIAICMSPFSFESSCARDGGMWWIIFQWRGTIFGRRGAGNSFTMSHTATRGSSWPYMNFNFFVTSVPGGWGWDYALIWEIGGVYPNMGTPQSHGFLGWLKNPYTLLLQPRCHWDKRTMGCRNIIADITLFCWQ